MNQSKLAKRKKTLFFDKMKTFLLTRKEETFNLNAKKCLFD